MAGKGRGTRLQNRPSEDLFHDCPAFPVPVVRDVWHEAETEIQVDAAIAGGLRCKVRPPIIQGQPSEGRAQEWLRETLSLKCRNDPDPVDAPAHLAAKLTIPGGGGADRTDGLMLEEQHATGKARVDRGKFHCEVSSCRYLNRERAGGRFDLSPHHVIPGPERPHAKPVRTREEWNAVHTQVLVKHRQRDVQHSVDLPPWSDQRLVVISRDSAAERHDELPTSKLGNDR